MIESRCGILCTECKYAKKMNCKGCVNIENPFWGKCDVKSCCEARGHAHCGLCPDFPCKVLESYSYDTGGEGDDGARIEQCRKWCTDCK